MKKEKKKKASITAQETPPNEQSVDADETVAGDESAVVDGGRDGDQQVAHTKGVKIARAKKPSGVVEEDMVCYRTNSLFHREYFLNAKRDWP